MHRVMEVEAVAVSDYSPSTIAQKTLERVAPELGLNPQAITIKWFLDEDEARRAGFTGGRIHEDEQDADGFMYPNDPATIYVRLKPGGKALAEVVAHELRHCWQAVHGYTYGCSRAERRSWEERDAAEYGQRRAAAFERYACFGGGAPWQPR